MCNNLKAQHDAGLKEEPHYCLSWLEGYYSSYLVIISLDKFERQKDTPWAQKSYLEEDAFNLSLVRQE